jgi:dihydrofolate reductase
MIISCIVAVGENNEIGVEQDLPWRLPNDLKFFKRTTKGHHILLGRKNFESIGRALPLRTNIVVTRDKEWYRSDVKIVHNILDGIKLAKSRGEDELFIIGGGNIYEQTKDLWDKLYLTQVDVSIPTADVFFPELDFDKWNLISEEKHNSDETHLYNYNFKIYQKK